MLRVFRLYELVVAVFWSLVRHLVGLEKATASLYLGSREMAKFL